MLQKLQGSPSTCPALLEVTPKNPVSYNMFRTEYREPSRPSLSCVSTWGATIQGPNVLGFTTGYSLCQNHLDPTIEPWD